VRGRVSSHSYYPVFYQVQSWTSLSSGFLVLFMTMEGLEPGSRLIGSRYILWETSLAFRLEYAMILFKSRFQLEKISITSRFHVSECCYCSNCPFSLHFICFLAFCYVLHEFPMFNGLLSSNHLEKGFEQCLTPRKSQVIVL
jgi:hypothetical protein